MDVCAVSASAEGDEYRLKGRSLHGWAIDVGAYIGTVSIPLAVDFPGLRVLAVEPVPENGDALEEHARMNGVSDRVTLVRAFASKSGVQSKICRYGWTHYGETGESIGAASDEYLHQHRFVGESFADIGNPQFRLEVPAVSLDSLISTYGIEEVALLKIDCEGCEWDFLDTPAVAHIVSIVGEYHTVLYESSQPHRRREAMVELLAKTHTVTFWDDGAICGLFSAERK